MCSNNNCNRFKVKMLTVIMALQRQSTDGHMHVNVVQEGCKLYETDSICAVLRQSFVDVCFHPLLTIRRSLKMENLVISLTAEGLPEAGCRT